MEKKNYITGTYKQQYQYKSYSPGFINKPFYWNDEEINVLLAEAMQKLGELNAYSKLLPEIDFFIHMHVVKESTASSKIEGTQTTINEALLPIEQISEEKRNDWQEVHNYTKAMNYAIKELVHLPLSIRLLRQTHKILLESSRGENKLPGEVRKSQNWIGGSSLRDAFYIPPDHTELPDLLSDLEKFLHNENLSIPQLIKIAIAHYQFETIHPFLDGNGRIGRLLITLYLVEREILCKPTLYLSDFFEKNRESYYDSLNMVRISNNIEQWIKFFLEGVRKTAKDSTETLEKVIHLSRKTEAKIASLGRKSKNAAEILNYLYQIPIIDTNDVSEKLNISFVASNNLIKDFVELGILIEETGFKRNRQFVFKEYLELFKK
ncbi:MAG: Fic family protein [Cyanobacteriota bacterium]